MRASLVSMKKWCSLFASFALLSISTLTVTSCNFANPNIHHGGSGKGGKITKFDLAKPLTSVENKAMSQNIFDNLGTYCAGGKIGDPTWNPTWKDLKNATTSQSLDNLMDGVVQSLTNNTSITNQDFSYSLIEKDLQKFPQGYLANSIQVPTIKTPQTPIKVDFNTYALQIKFTANPHSQWLKNSFTWKYTLQGTYSNN